MKSRVGAAVLAALIFTSLSANAQTRVLTRSGHDWDHHHHHWHDGGVSWSIGVGFPFFFGGGYPYYGGGYGYPYYGGYYPGYGYGYPSYGYGYGYPVSYYGATPAYYGGSPYAGAYGGGYYNRAYYSRGPLDRGYNGSVTARVQQRLARAGYYRGAIDGVMGPRTRSAIRAYQRSHGLPVNGAIGRQLLATMGLA